MDHATIGAMGTACQTMMSGYRCVSINPMYRYKEYSVKNLKTILTALAMFVASSATLADSPPVVNPYGRFLEGDGVEVEMAELATRNNDGSRDALLRMTGANAFNAGIDGKTLKYQAARRGSGVDYLFEGKARMIVRGDSWSTIQVFLDGKTVTLTENKSRSKEVRPLHLLSESEANSK